MAELSVHRVESLHDYVAIIEGLREQSGDQLWFRGSSRSGHSLLPSLYRHTGCTTDADFLRVEADIFNRFRQRSIPYQARPITERWEYLFLMQHYGVPTRLLDWTENPFVALYFSLLGVQSWNETTTMEEEECAVWVLDPGAWNRVALDHFTFREGVLSFGDNSPADDYIPNPIDQLRNRDPIAIYAAYNSNRIVAQRGVFIIFGLGRDPIEAIFAREAFSDSVLTKIVVPGPVMQRTQRNLTEMGFTPSVIFPDLDGSAREIRYDFGFGR